MRQYYFVNIVQKNNGKKEMKNKQIKEREQKETTGRKHMKNMDNTVYALKR